MELYPHQQTAVDNMHNGCILVGGVGAGKSLTAVAYFYTKVCKGVIGDHSSMREPRDLYIITTAKKRDSFDWQKDCAALGLGRDRVTSVGNVQVVVDSWNNIDKYADVEDAFFIFDEQRLVGAGAWSQQFIRLARRNQWCLLSATPGDNWLDYIPVFIANGFYKNRTEFKRQHVVYNTFTKFPKVDRYVDVGTLVRHRNAILVEMPYKKHTVRHDVEVEVDYDVSTFEKVWKRRWHVYESRPLRDIAEMFSVGRRVVNSDKSRLTALTTLLQSHPKVIVFYSFDYELEILRTLGSLLDCSTESPISSSQLKSRKGSTTGSWNFSIAEWNGHKHEPIPTSERWVYLVQYTAGAEGWNCVETDAVVFYSLQYSHKVWEQAHGRIDRLNTPFTDLWYYILLSNSLIDRLIMKALRGKKTFHESGLKL